MPWPPHPCADCGELVPHGTRRCKACQSRADRKHNARPSRRIYRDPVYRSIPLVGACWICGADPAVGPTRDHVREQSYTGPANDPTGIRIACRSCNSARSAHLAAERRRIKPGG